MNAINSGNGRLISGQTMAQSFWAQFWAWIKYSWATSGWWKKITLVLRAIWALLVAGVRFRILSAGLAGLAALAIILGVAYWFVMGGYKWLFSSTMWMLFATAIFIGLWWHLRKYKDEDFVKIAGGKFVAKPLRSAPLWAIAVIWAIWVAVQAIILGWQGVVAIYKLAADWFFNFSGGLALWKVALGLLLLAGIVWVISILVRWARKSREENDKTFGLGSALVVGMVAVAILNTILFLEAYLWIAFAENHTAGFLGTNLSLWLAVSAWLVRDKEGNRPAWSANASNILFALALIGVSIAGWEAFRQIEEPITYEAVPGGVLAKVLAPIDDWSKNLSVRGNKFNLETVPGRKFKVKFLGYEVKDGRRIPLVKVFVVNDNDHDFETDGVIQEILVQSLDGRPMRVPVEMMSRR